jgi:hypothetical protein
MCNSLDSITHEAFCVDYDPSQCINPSLLTKHAQESQNCFPPDSRRLAEGELTRDSQSQFSPTFPPLSGVQQLPPTPSSSVHDLQQTWLFCPSASSLSSSDKSKLESEGTSDSDQGFDDVPDGKREISSTRSAFVCTTCNEMFSSPMRFRQHVNRRNCQALSICPHCKTTFSQPKNLTRHLGVGKATPSCPALKASGRHQKPFVCTCNNVAYTRKDSLQRHMDLENARVAQRQHKCKSCGDFRCTCQSNKRH